MKKILLASTVALSMAGFAKTTVYAEDSQATNNVQSSEKIAINTVSNEKKNQSEAEKATSQTPETKEQPSKETVVEVVNKEGWQKENNQWRYYENNQPVSNWKKIAGVWYYFNQEGYMFTGWLFYNNAWYYFEENEGSEQGKMSLGWKEIRGFWYYFSEEVGAENGKMRTGWQELKGKWYYLNPQAGADNGKMLFNTKVDGYILGTDGAWQTA